MGWHSTSSLCERALIEPLERRALLAVTAIQDLTLGHASSGKPAYEFVVSNGKGFFTRSGELSIGALWTTDGVTATLIGPGPQSFRDMMPVEIGVVGMRDGVPSQVWRSDGTAAGTYRVGNVNGVHSSLFDVVALRGHYFVNDDNFNAGIYETDGSSLWFRGRVLGAWSGMAEYNDNIVFGTWVHPDGSGLYTLNSAGVITRYIDPPTLGGFPGELVNVSAGIVLLVDKGNADSADVSLWRTDGTAGNTVALKESFGLDTQGVSIIGSDKQRALIQVADQSFRRSLWSTDGTAEGTVEIRPQLIRGREYKVVGNAGGHTLFAITRDGPAPSQLWATDGTPESTHLLTDLVPYPGYQVPLLNTWPTLISLSNMPSKDGVTYFVNSDPQHGAEIWRTDGTPQGTRLAFDLVAGPGSGQPKLAGILGDRLLFNVTLDGHLGLFAVDLQRRPTLPAAPIAPTSAAFSDTLVSSPTKQNLLDALDVLTGPAEPL